MGLIPVLAQERKVTIAGVTFVVVAPKELSAEKLGYDLYLNIPINVSKNVYSALGSEKLRLQLETGPTDKIGAITFLKRALSLDLKTPNAINLAKLAFSEFGRGTYLHLALLAKMRNWWRRTPLAKKEHDEVVQILATEISGRFGGKASHTRHRERLLKDELVLTIKRQQEDGRD